MNTTTDKTRRNTLSENDIEALSLLDLKRLAQAPHLSKQELSSLSKNDNFQVRLLIAGRASLPQDLLDELSFDDETVVRLAIASRDDLPLFIVQRLLNDNNIWVRDEMRSNLKCYSPDKSKQGAREPRSTYLVSANKQHFNNLKNKTL